MQDSGFEGIRSDFISRNTTTHSTLIPAVTSIGASVRQWRRSVGLTQAQLAELIGVTQGLVSRWESGHEALPARQLNSVYNLMSNKTRSLDPLIKRFLRGNAMYGVLTDGTDFCYALSDNLLQRLQLNCADVEGKPYAAVFDQRWRRTSGFINADRTDLCYWEYDRDVMLAEQLSNRRKRPFRQHFRMAGCYVDFEGCERVLITWVKKIEVPKFELAPRIHKIIKHSDVHKTSD